MLNSGLPMKLRIIVLDSDESLRNLLSVIAQKKGHEVIAQSEPITCPIYTESESNCPQDHPCGDLLIVDNRMTKMSGLKLIEKQMEGGCKGATRNKLVLSTSANTEEEIQFADRIGCKILRKPFRIEEITKWIDEREKEIAPDRKLAVLG